MKEQKNKSSKWNVPANYLDYFDPASDEAFRQRHPIGYGLLVALGITVLLLPAVIFAILAGSGTDSYWMLLGCAGGFIFGIGLFNFVGIIIKQYMGHWFSLICFMLGSVIMLISWFLCR